MPCSPLVEAALTLLDSLDLSQNDRMKSADEWVGIICNRYMRTWLKEVLNSPTSPKNGSVELVDPVEISQRAIVKSLGEYILTEVGKEKNKLRTEIARTLNEAPTNELEHVMGSAGELTKMIEIGLRVKAMMLKTEAADPSPEQQMKLDAWNMTFDKNYATWGKKEKEFQRLAKATDPFLLEFLAHNLGDLGQCFIEQSPKTPADRRAMIKRQVVSVESLGYEVMKLKAIEEMTEGLNEEQQAELFERIRQEHGRMLGPEVLNGIMLEFCGKNVPPSVIVHITKALSAFFRHRMEFDASLSPIFEHFKQAGQPVSRKDFQLYERFHEATRIDYPGMIANAAREFKRLFATDLFREKQCDFNQRALKGAVEDFGVGKMLASHRQCIDALTRFWHSVYHYQAPKPPIQGKLGNDEQFVLPAVLQQASVFSHSLRMLCQSYSISLPAVYAAAASSSVMMNELLNKMEFLEHSSSILGISSEMMTRDVFIEELGKNGYLAKLEAAGLYSE